MCCPQLWRTDGPVKLGVQIESSGPRREREIRSGGSKSNKYIVNIYATI